MITIGNPKPDQEDDWFGRLFKWVLSTVIILSILPTIATFVFVAVGGKAVLDVIANIINK